MFTLQFLSAFTRGQQQGHIYHIKEQNVSHLNVTCKGRRKSDTSRASGDLKGSVTWKHNMCHLATQLSQKDTWLNRASFPATHRGYLYKCVYSYIQGMWSNYCGCGAMKDSHADLRWDSWQCSLPPSSHRPASRAAVHFLCRHRCQHGRWMSRASPPWCPFHKGWCGGLCWEIWEKIRDRCRSVMF